MWPQSRYRGRQRVYLQAMRPPTSFTRKSRVQPKKILIASAQRLFQQHRSRATLWETAPCPLPPRPDMGSRPLVAYRTCRTTTAAGSGAQTCNRFVPAPRFIELFASASRSVSIPLSNRRSYPLDCLSCLIAVSSCCFRIVLRQLRL